ncbi:MAG TPA: hypothetical protein VIH33_07610 [Candidatus Limnocylindria bacterium]
MTTPRLATGLLLGAALLLAAAGLVAVSLGLFFAPWLYDQLPPVVIDSAAVGGAATALGLLLLGLAAAHLAAALGLIRGVAVLHTPAVVLCLAMAVLSLAWAVAALVSAAAGTGIPAAMLPAAVALGAVAAAYGWAARRLIGPPRSPSASD